MNDLATLIHQELSGERAQEITAEITRFHRPPGSAGYHAATNLVAEHLRNAGVEEIVSTPYPLDGETPVGKGPLPLAWEPYGATLKIVNPVQEELVDMATTSSCLAWWSKPTPPGGLRAELIDVGTGESAQDFDGKDLTGKIAFIHHSDRRAAWMHASKEALERGAVGIVTDYLFYPSAPYRTREALPEAVQLLRLRPNQSGRYDAWACSISYPAGERLRELLRLGPVSLHADIQCKLFKGHGQNLLATIPGRELPDESVFFVAHTSAATCPCANCAAGPALMVEIARTLTTLIDRGAIRRPRRSIKFLYIIEGSGSTAYIAANSQELRGIKTTFCFDSVGHNQEKLKSVLLFYRHPDSSPTFLNDYFAGIMDHAPKDGTWVYSTSPDISPVQFTQAPYTPWSDNHIWAAYGIPSPLIMSWPDLYFHTQLLTADNTDPRVFRRAGVTTALAAYQVADAGLEEALAIAGEVAARSTFRLASVANLALQKSLAGQAVQNQMQESAAIAERAERELRYFAQRDARAITSVVSLIPGEVPENTRKHLDRLGEDLIERARYTADQVKNSLNVSSQKNVVQSAALEAVLHRRSKAPASALDGISYPELSELFAEMLAQDDRLMFDALRSIGDEFWNSIDGRRSLREIAEALCLQFGFELDPELFLPLANGLANAGMISFSNESVTGQED
jgi:hypothetical protein